MGEDSKKQRNQKMYNKQIIINWINTFPEENL